MHKCKPNRFILSWLFFVVFLTLNIKKYNYQTIIRCLYFDFFLNVSLFHVVTDANFIHLLCLCVMVGVVHYYYYFFVYFIWIFAFLIECVVILSSWFCSDLFSLLQIRRVFTCHKSPCIHDFGAASVKKPGNSLEQKYRRRRSSGHVSFMGRIQFYVHADSCR